MGEVGNLREVKAFVGVARGRVLVVRLDGDELVTSSRDNNRLASVLAPSAFPERSVTDHAVAARGGAVLLGVVKRNNGGAIGNDLLDNGT